MSETPLFAAEHIARILSTDPAKPQLPTPEQTQVIEQPVPSSVLVIAGAGSGKTETMANRVIWLVANGYAEPENVLGLTFTRKAAAELQQRVVRRLRDFTEKLTLPHIRAELAPLQREGAERLQRLLGSGLSLPEVSTYNAFASSIVQEFGPLAGVSSAAAVIDHSAAWAIARKVVCESELPQLSQGTDSIATIVGRVMRLEHQVNEHLTTFERVLEEIGAAERIAELPYNEKRDDGQYSAIATIVKNMAATRTTVALAREFAAEKARRGVIEFSDQLALAVHTISRSTDAIHMLRARWPFVLLDEVQDTSYAQTALLSQLFSASTVMAVGDPHQSIYGFRGASASNLRTFHSDFSDKNAKVRHHATLTLSTSWRNPTEVLRAANVISEPLLRALESEAPDIAVNKLTSRYEYTGATERSAHRAVDVSVTETIDEEFETLAQWMRDAKNHHLVEQGEAPTAAVLFRGRKHMPAVSAALWRHGVANRIVGLGGLLSTPEVTDIVATMRCVWFADAHSELIRLLAGPRFRIGVKDIAALAEVTKWFAHRDYTHQRQSSDRQHSIIADPDSQFTVLDALDEIASLKTLDHLALSPLTDQAKLRVNEAALMLRELRQYVGSDIVLLIRKITERLFIDIELDAAEHSELSGKASAQANIESFIDVVQSFRATDEHATLASVLDWLERATEEDELAEHVADPDPSYVQLLTVHAAKGLEYDLVAIPRMVNGEFPSQPREGLGWFRPGELPDALRGDAQARPRLRLNSAQTQREALDAIDTYKAELVDKSLEEERRLAYVALTRTKSRLLMTASFWAGTTKPRTPSTYLCELKQQGIVDSFELHSKHDSDPTERRGRTLQWPLDPLGDRRSVVMTAAARLQNALDEPTLVANVAVDPVVELLIAEQATEQHALRDKSVLHSRLTASRVHEVIIDPGDSLRKTLRPIPEQPHAETLVGNLFHEWVERRSGIAVATALQLDYLFEQGASGAASSKIEQQLNKLQENFELSRWGGLKPIAVECELTVPFASTMLVCKLDAVYSHVNDGVRRIEIVDWKTGKPPRNAQERQSRFVQLNLYRAAYAKFASIPISEIDVTLFYVADNLEIRGESAQTLEEIESNFVNALSAHHAT